MKASIRKVSALLAIACLSPAASARQGPGPSAACNDQARQATTLAGTSSTGGQDCASFSLTVLGITFSTPSTCSIGVREQTKDCFGCAESSPGNHCKARGFQTNTKVYSIGGGNPCPTLPTPLPTTLEGAQAAVSCKELPQIANENTWCAKQLACESETIVVSSSSAEGGGNFLIQNHDAGPRFAWSGNPEEVLPPGRPRPLWERVKALGQAPLSELPDALSMVALLHPPLVRGVKLSATIETLYSADASRPEILNRKEVSGLVLSDCRFLLRSPQVARNDDGEYSRFTEVSAYDGASFFSGVEEDSAQAAFHVYASTSGGFEGALATHTSPLRPLFTWVDRPFGLFRLPGTEYFADPIVSRPNSIVSTIHESYPGADYAFAGEVVYRIELSGAVPHPTRVEVMDFQGRLHLSREYSDYRELEMDIWRPFQLKESQYSAATGKLEWTKTVRIHSAHIAEIDENSNQWNSLASTIDNWIVHR